MGVNGWWMWGKKGKDKRCPKRSKWSVQRLCSHNSNTSIEPRKETVLSSDTKIAFKKITDMVFFNFLEIEKMIECPLKWYTVYHAYTYCLGIL